MFLWKTSSEAFFFSLYWSCIDAQALKWISPLQGDKFYTNMYKAEVSEDSIVFLSLFLKQDFKSWLMCDSVPFRQRCGSTSSSGWSSWFWCSSRDGRPPGQSWSPGASLGQLKGFLASPVRLHQRRNRFSDRSEPIQREYYRSGGKKHLQ